MKLRDLMIIVLIASIPYAYNAYKLAGCDFESNYKCEVVHGIGLAIPPAAYATAWFADDRK